MDTVLLHDVSLDLVQILEEASDSGRLVGGEDTTLERVETRTFLERDDTIVLTLSNGETVELRVKVK